MSLDPCGSFEPSFVDFGQQRFFLYSATMVHGGIMLFVNDFVVSDLFPLLDNNTVRTGRISARLSTFFHKNTVVSSTFNQVVVSANKSRFTD